MKLVILLFVLLIKRYAPLQQWLSYCHLSDTGFQQMRISLGARMNSLTGFLVFTIPPTFFMACIYFVLRGHFYALPIFLLNIVVLTYILTATAPERGHESPKTGAAWAHLCNTELFAVLFWFVIFGYWGAVAITFYHMVRALHAQTHDHSKGLTVLHRWAAQVQGVLNWPVSRVIGLLYALAGNFRNTFTYGLAHLVSTSLVQNPLTHDWLADGAEFLKGCAHAALGVTPNDSAKSVTEATRELVDRSLVIFLVAVALGTLGSLFV